MENTQNMTRHIFIYATNIESIYNRMTWFARCIEKKSNEA